MPQYSSHDQGERTSRLVPVVGHQQMLPWSRRPICPSVPLASSFDASITVTITSSRTGQFSSSGLTSSHCSPF